MPDPKHSDAVKELVAAANKTFEYFGWRGDTEPSDRLMRAVRAVEEEMRPKPRWTQSGRLILEEGVWVLSATTEELAARYVAALNAADAQREGKGA